MPGEAVVFTIGADTSSFDKTLGQLKGETRAAASSVDSSLSSAFDSAKNSINSAGNAISIGVTAPLLVVAGIAGKTAVEFTKLYESTMIVFKSMLGGDEAAQALYGSLLDIARGSTFAQETFLTCGKKLVGMGVDAETTKTILQATTNAVAGFGGSSQNIEQVTEAFAKMSNAGKLSMEDVNTLSDNGIQVLKILGNQYGVTTDEMREMISSGAVPAKEAIEKLTSGIEDGTTGVNGMTNSMAGMAASMKAGTLTGAFDSINSAIRSFSLALIGINPTLKETDAGYAESTERIKQLTAAVTTVSEIIPLLAKVFSGVTDAIGHVLDAIIGTNVNLDEATHQWTNVGGALGEFKRYLRDTPTEQLAMIGNLLVAIAVTGPALKLVSVAMGALRVAIAASSAITTAAAAAHGVYTWALQAQTASSAAATAATWLLNNAIKSNPAVFVITAIVGLVAAIWALAIAANNTAAKNEILTVSAQAQKDKISELQEEYDLLCQQQGANSDAALATKSTLDEETAAFDASKQTVSELVNEIEDSSAAHKSLMEDLGKTERAAEDEAGSILALVGQFDALANKENRSEGDKVRLKAITDELNASVEGLNISYDMSNDALSMTAEAVDAVCRAEANRIRYQQKMDEIPKLLVEEAEKSELLAEAKKELETAQGRLTEADKKSAAGFRENAGASGRATAEYRKYSGATSAASKDVQTLTASINTQEAELEETRATIAETELSAAKFATQETALAAAATAVAAGMDSATAATQYNVDAGELAQKLAADEAIAQEELAQKLNETEQAITDYCAAHPGFQEVLSNAGLSVSGLSELLTNQGASFDEAAKEIEVYSSRAASGFDKVADSSKNSLSVLYETLAYNLEATQNWGSNLQEVFGRTGVSFSQEFVDAVKKGGVEEYGTAMAQMRDLSDSELQEISDAYARNGQAGVDNWIAEQQLLVPGTKDALADTGEAVDAALQPGVDAAGQSGTGTGVAYTENLKATIAACPEEVQTYITQLESKLQSAQPAAAQAGTDTGTGYSSSLQTALSTCPAEVQTYISQLEDKLRVMETQAGIIGTGTGTGYGANIAAGISAQTGAVSTSTANLRAAAELELAPMPLYGATKGTDTGIGFAGGLRDQGGLTGDAASRLAAAAENPLASVDGEGYGSGAGSGFGSGLGGTEEAVAANANLISECCTTWVSLARLAWIWGQDVGENFGYGVRAGADTAVAEAENMAARIRAILHFSVPDEGPLSDADEYGPDFVKLLATGMRSQIGLLRAATIDTAGAINDGLDIGLNQEVITRYELAQESAAAIIPRIPAIPGNSDKKDVLQELAGIRESVDGFRRSIGREIATNAPSTMDVTVSNPRELGRAINR